MGDNDLLSKPNRMHNTNEMNLQIKKKTTHVLSSKGVQWINTVNGTEKVKNISLNACCHDEVTFLRHVLSFKEQN